MNRSGLGVRIGRAGAEDRGDLLGHSGQQVGLLGHSSLEQAADQAEPKRAVKL